MPSVAIYAISIDGSSYYRVETVAWQQSYTIVGVAPGDYFVLTSVRGIAAPTASNARIIESQRFGAGYTKAVPCGLSVACVDHSLVAVRVSPGTTIMNIDPTDWYADPTVYPYPLVPSPAPSVPTVSDHPTAFSTAQEAAIWLATFTTVGRQAANVSDCPANTACFSLVSNTQGHQAAYFVAIAGSNKDLLACGLYLAEVGSGWRTLNALCHAQPAFPAVGSTGRVLLGMGETGCVNVHDSPALGARVVACLDDGTTVALDGGPYYSPATGSDPNRPGSEDYWWHIAGKGWMVHRYLSYR